MSPILPQRYSLIEQTAQALRTQLAQHEWTARLPSEQALAALFNVGRNTVRAALALLEAEGRIKTTNGRRREIVPAAARRQPQVQRAVLIMARPVGEFPPSTTLWIHGTRSRLETLGWQLHVFVEPEVYRARPAKGLEAMTATRPDTVWILHRSTAAMQHWFQEQGLRTVLAGSRHEGITLPNVDSDLRAASRHAAGRFLAQGHRRLAILRPVERFAGDAESVLGFREGVGAAAWQEVACQNHPAGVIRALRQLLKSPQPPTGLYVLHPEHCVTALSYLLGQGIAVPSQLSLICRDDEPYLSLLTPEPTRYRRSARAMAAKLTAQVLAVVKATGRAGKSLTIMPASVSGETLTNARPILKKDSL
jgi:DNA-binding LacI/PurR family transcriptional regulator